MSLALSNTVAAKMATYVVLAFDKSLGRPLVFKDKKDLDALETTLL